MAELQLIHTASGKQLSRVYASIHGCACSLISKHKSEPYRGFPYQSMWLKQEIVCELPTSPRWHSNPPAMGKNTHVS